MNGTTIFGVSKTTVAGILSFFVTTFTILTGLQVPIIFNTNANHFWAYLSGASAIGLALCRAWVGMLQGDPAPIPPATPPAGSGTGSTAALILGLLMLSVSLATGCAKPGPLPVWAVTAPEATTGSIISAAVSAVNQYEVDVKTGYVPPAVMKTAMQDIQKALSVAQPQYVQWNAALKANPQSTEPADLAAAISTIQATLAQLPTLTK